MRIIDADRPDIRFEFASEEERDSCIHSGDCYDDCLTLVEDNSSEFERIPRESAIKALKVTGGWEKEKLEEMTALELYIKIAWIAAGNARDVGSFKGYISTY